MKRYRIVPIVEGHGEQFAVPRLLERWLKFRKFTNFEVRNPAIRARGASALKCAHDDAEELGIEHYVHLAARQNPSGILVLLDADDECLIRARSTSRLGLGPELQQRARAIAPHIPIEVVVADREYEAWFLHAEHELVKAGKIPEREREKIIDGTIERIRDCKGRLAQWLGRPYEPSIDQADLTNALPFSPALAKRSRSYRKLLSALEALTRAARRRA